MGRRRKNDDWIEALFPLVGFVVLLSMVSPQVRQLIAAIGIIAVIIVVVVVAGFIGFGIYRFSTRSQQVRVIDIDEDLGAPVNDTYAAAKRRAPVDLIQQLRSIDWFQFEQLIALMYRKLGYTVTRRGGANPDGGIDLIIEKDGRRWAVQCKHWKNWKVGAKHMREFLGALTAAQICGGIFVTLNDYTSEARDFADKHRIEIVGRDDLVRMLESVHANFDFEVLALLQDKRKLCPKCESEMILRTASRGPGAGEQFWGCSNYPRRRYTMPFK